MNLEYIFPTPVWSIDFNLDLNKIKSYILNEKITTSGRSISNKGGWQSQDYSIADLPEDLFGKFFKRTQKNLQECFYQYGTSQIPVIDNIWFNVNSKNNYNISHFHAGCFLSACFYIQADQNSGNIIFERSAMEDYTISSVVGLSKSKLGASKWKYEAIPNRLLIFPAWLSHKVEENNSSIERISMAFNIKGENK